MGSMNVLHTGANVFGNVGACMHRPEGLKAGALQDDARASRFTTPVVRLSVDEVR